jgi:DNA-binding LytR/AlgR family response regulator
VVYQIAICDDDGEQAERLRELAADWAEKTGNACQVTCFSSAEALWFAYAEKKDFAVFLLDVEMKAMTGIQLAKRLRADGCRGEIIFITSHFEFMGEGYEVDALHYLIKPVSPEKVFSVLTRAVQRLAVEPPSVVISREGESVKLYESEILYVESFLHDLVIHTTGEEYRIRENISDFARKLSPDFYRAHRSYLVNLKKVRCIGRTAVTLEGGGTVPLARGKYDEINRAFIARN